MSSKQEPDETTLAQRVERLFRTVHPAGRGPYTLEEVSEGIRAQGGPVISAAYLHQLRSGRRDNPTKQNLEALARFFGVPVAYFFDDTTSAAVDEELALLRAIRDGGIKDLALRALDLSPETRQSLARFVEEISDIDRRAHPSRRRRRKEPDAD